LVPIILKARLRFISIIFVSNALAIALAPSSHILLSWKLSFVSVLFIFNAVAIAIAASSSKLLRYRSSIITDLFLFKAVDNNITFDNIISKKVVLWVNGLIYKHHPFVNLSILIYEYYNI
jgi:hypothetical protein